MRTLLTGVLFAAVLSGCSSPQQESSAVQATTAEEAAAREQAATAPSLDSAQMGDLKGILKSEGKACAEVVTVQPREAENAVDVICVEYVGGTHRVTHRIDLGSI